MSPQSKQKIRYAVVGLGHIAQVAVLPAFQSVTNSELVAIVSDDADKRRELKDKYGLEQAYSYEEYERALAAVDAVYITLPTTFTVNIACALPARVFMSCAKSRWRCARTNARQ